jgi:cohesin complex subunit SCC1
MARPHLGDDGALAPALLEVWYQSTAELMGKPRTFLLRGRKGQEELADQAVKEAAEAEDIEGVRRADDSDSGGRAEEEEEEFPMPDQTDEFPQEEYEEAAVPFDDDRVPPAEGRVSELDMAVGSPAISLGLVNEMMLSDEEEEDRQVAGSEAISSSSKWHVHTVKVLAMLKQNMGMGEGAEGEEPKLQQLSFDDLSKGCSRRTAASVFFELLQLKNWDFVDLDQEEEEGGFGDITITPGVRFNENPENEDNAQAGE